MIRLEKVRKTYSRKSRLIHALKDIDLDISRGEFLVVGGPSGSGKTTLLMCLGGMMHPSSGFVKFEVRDIYAQKNIERSRHRALHIGFVFQTLYLVPYLNVLGNVMLSPGTKGDGKAQQKAVELIDRLGLTGRILHKPSELSAGECQRVALARAMIHEPDIVLADEPTGNLDIDNSAEVFRILGNYHRSGGTVILATHGKDAARYADRVLNLKEGRIIDGT